jgi:tRNA threonylcarbamoyladenosine biosynthesis protein TsaB
MVICIETATNLCSVALCNSAGVISLRESNEQKSHASQLTVFIEELLNENHLHAADLEAIAVSKGPGSYTGLRIGVSVAKGIAYGASIPLIAIDTTFSMFYGLRGSLSVNPADDSESLFCPMLDARRMEVYYSIYDFNGNVVKPVSAEVITENTFNEIPENRKIILFGDGAEKCRNVIKRKNIMFADNFSISASYMQEPVYKALQNQQFEDIAYFEPFYLKDFMTTLPRKNVLGNTPR